MRYGSLFTGIGGFDLGLDRAGMTCAWQVESDPAARTVLERHWPTVPRHEDVRDVHATISCGNGLAGRGTVGHVMGREAQVVDRGSVEPRPRPVDDEGPGGLVGHSGGACGRCIPTVDVVCGGFPCQDISLAGRREGLAGERSGLWWKFHRIVSELAPRWVVIENVADLLSSGNRRDMGVIVGALGDLGYGYAWRVLDSQWFGVAQRRRRVFIVGHLGPPFGRAAQVLLEPEGVPWDSPSRGTSGQVASAPTRSGVGAGGGADDNAAQANHLIPEVTSFNWMQGHGEYTLNREVTTTLGTVSQPGVLQRHRVRRLTPTECERLQGFPDGWTDGQSDAARYRQLGNAVTVNVAHWIGQRITAVAS